MKVRCFVPLALVAATGLASPAASSSTAPIECSPAKSGSALACVPSALSPEERHRHFDELSPTLRARRKSARELSDGYEFEFAADRATYDLVTEWARGESVCCPFFDVTVRRDRDGGALWLRLTGRDGVKQFIRADFGPDWFRSGATSAERN